MGLRQALEINLKSEARISKQIPMTEMQNSKQLPPEIAVSTSGDFLPRMPVFWSFGHSNFGFVSDFDIRISSFNPKIDGALKPSEALHHCAAIGAIL